MWYFNQTIQSLNKLVDKKLAVQNELSDLLQESNISSKQIASMQKEISNLQKLESLQHEFQSHLNQLQECNEILAPGSEEEDDIKEIAAADKETLLEQLEEGQTDIQDYLIPVNPMDANNVTLEIRQAAGGSESSLFAEDLLKMYEKYA